MSETEHIPAEGTLEYVDYLLEGLGGETKLSERYAIVPGSVDFNRGLLRAAYQNAIERMERKDGDANANPVLHHRH